MGERQRGQERVERSQVSMQVEWKAWRQEGRRRSWSCGWKRERQTAQSGEDFGRAARADARVNSGSDSIRSACSPSRPRRADGDEGAAVSVAEEEEDEAARRRRTSGEEAPEEEAAWRERARRRRWMVAETTKTKTMMAAMTRRPGGIGPLLSRRRMEMEVVVGKVPPSASIPETCAEVVSPAEGEAGGRGADGEKPAARKVRRRALVAVLEQCRRALELLDDTGLHECGGSNAGLVEEEEEEEEQQQHPSLGSSSSTLDSEVEELHDLLKSKVESPKFLEKLGSIHMSVSQKVSVDESTTWDVVTARDLWDDEHSDSGNGSDEDDDNYVLVKQEDIVDGIACFMAAYLLSLKETKELTPNQLQEALSKTFSIKKKKGKLRKAWDGGKVIYNVASWSATAIGIYQNPALFRVASVAFWTSCHAISKLL